MSFSLDKTRAFLPALLGNKYVDLMVVPCVVQRRDRTLASRVPSLVQSCSRPRCVENFWDEHEQNITLLDRIMVGSLKGAGYGILGLFLHKGFFHTVSALQR